STLIPDLSWKACNAAASGGAPHGGVKNVMLLPWALTGPCGTANAASAITATSRNSLCSLLSLFVFIISTPSLENILHGQWIAHNTPNQSVVLVLLSSKATRQSCGLPMPAAPQSLRPRLVPRPATG